jgi:Uma2 family endonuclease
MAAAPQSLYATPADDIRSAGHLTVEDWFNLPDGPDRHELYKGVLIVLPPPGGGHQSASSLLFEAFVQVARSIGATVLHAPTGVALAEDVGFEPDIVLFIDGANAKLYDKGVFGAPEIVVEILSPSTRGYDLAIKVPTYLAHGVQEVWLVDIERRTTSIYREDSERPAAECAFGEAIPSTVVAIGDGSLGRYVTPPPFKGWS